jgi:nuclear protein localization protein 4 homolog
MDSSNADGNDLSTQFKHIAFDSHLVEMRKKCAKLHAPHQKCQHCTWSQSESFKVNFKCKNHPPYPKGMCNKCTPPAVVLNRQKYRHVDYCSFMNFKEISSFVGHWQRSGCLEQRIAYLYGYYSEDPNYPEGVRVNVEAIYEPPQIGDVNGATELADPKRHIVDMVAAGLGLERIGWIFTKID